MGDARIMLVKPGDLLIFGNVGELDVEDTGRLNNLGELLKDTMGVAGVVIFEGDIDLAAVPSGKAG